MSVLEIKAKGTYFHDDYNEFFLEQKVSVIAFIIFFLNIFVEIAKCSHRYSVSWQCFTKKILLRLFKYLFSERIGVNVNKTLFCHEGKTFWIILSFQKIINLYIALKADTHNFFRKWFNYFNRKETSTLSLDGFWKVSRLDQTLGASSLS